MGSILKFVITRCAIDQEGWIENPQTLPRMISAHALQRLLGGKNHLKLERARVLPVGEESEA